MEYLMHHPHKPIIYSKNNIFKLNNILQQCFFNECIEEIKKHMNNPDYFTYTVAKIMQYISRTGLTSPQQATSSIEM